MHDAAVVAKAIEPTSLLGELVTAKDSAPNPIASTVGAEETRAAIDEQELANLIRKHAARVMRLDPDVIDSNQPLSELGMDSLMAVELKYQIESGLGVEVPMRNLVEKPTVAQLATQLGDLLRQQSSLIETT